jgi:O-acetylserine/cysteine efflux transporter
LLALLVVAIWGTNFVVIRWALSDFTPLWMACLRFAIAALPVLFFALRLPAIGLAKPEVPWGDLVRYGLLIGAGQFALLYLAMNGHIAPGLASLVIQTQVFFTIGLSMFFSGERLRRHQIVALGLAVAGLVLIGYKSGIAGNGTTSPATTPLGVGMVLLAAASWAGGNIVVRKARGVPMLNYVVWSSLGAIPPLLILALVVEGPDALAHSVQTASAASWAALLWQALGNTLFGYAVWGWLLQRHPAATISPWALLVPVFGMSSAVWLLNEPMPWWKLTAAALVIGGLALNLAWPVRPRPS